MQYINLIIIIHFTFYSRDINSRGPLCILHKNKLYPFKISGSHRFPFTKTNKPSDGIWQDWGLGDNRVGNTCGMRFNLFPKGNQRKNQRLSLVILSEPLAFFRLGLDTLINVS